METSAFSLVKWYMDCVTDHGDVAILYCADLHWRGLHAHIGSLLVSGPDAAPVTRTSLGRYQLAVTSDEIAIQHLRLKVHGSWRADSQSFPYTVFEDPAGSVHWNCIQPRSRVTLHAGQRDFHGIGYAECLTLTLPPWRLPMRELRWGRFVSADQTLAWIDWRGPFSTSIAVLDSRPCILHSVSGSEVIAADSALRIAPGTTLRSGRLGSTILPGASGLRKLFPRAIFNVHEQKSLSPGVLTASGHTSKGWVIHEVVQWEL